MSAPRPSNQVIAAGDPPIRRANQRRNATHSAGVDVCAEREQPIGHGPHVGVDARRGDDAVQGGVADLGGLGSGYAGMGSGVDEEAGGRGVLVHAGEVEGGGFVGGTEGEVGAEVGKGFELGRVAAGGGEVGGGCACEGGGVELGEEDGVGGEGCAGVEREDGEDDFVEGGVVVGAHYVGDGEEGCDALDAGRVGVDTVEEHRDGGFGDGTLKGVGACVEEDLHHVVAFFADGVDQGSLACSAMHVVNRS